MINTNKVQSFVNTGLLWFIDPSSCIKENDSVKNNEKNSQKKYHIKRYSTVITYTISYGHQIFSIT